MKTITLSTPVHERDPDTWLVLGSGPNRDGWEVFAEQHKANVICCNGSLMLCSNPSSYVATDIVAKLAYKYLYESLPVRIFIGRESIEAINPSYQINSTRVRTVAVWATYISLNVFNAKHVHLFGVYGSTSRAWSSISFLSGTYKCQKEYEKAVKINTNKSKVPLPVVLAYQGSPDESNTNTASHLRHLQHTHPNASITIHGGGPVSELFASMPNP